MNRVNLVETNGGAQVFNVPNTIAGREFVKLLKTYLNGKRYSIKARGRGKNRRMKTRGYREDLPVEMSNWMAIYINGVVPYDFPQQLKETWRKGHLEGIKLGKIHERIALKQRIEALNQEIGDTR